MSGSMLAKELDVSRQVIVQDIALLKAAGYEILSTNKGYVINDVAAHTRVFKVYHTNDQTEDEFTEKSRLNLMSRQEEMFSNV